jgi:hypothetical protein
MTTIDTSPDAGTAIAQILGRILLGFVIIYAVYFGSALPLAAVEPTLAALARTLLTLVAVVVVEMSLFRQPGAGSGRPPLWQCWPSRPCTFYCF